MDSIYFNNNVLYNNWHTNLEEFTSHVYVSIIRGEDFHSPIFLHGVVQS